MLSAVINGVKYQRGTVVICEIEEDTPMFGRISEIIVTPQYQCIFVVTAFITIAFQHHYHAYVTRYEKIDHSRQKMIFQDGDRYSTELIFVSFFFFSYYESMIYCLSIHIILMPYDVL